MKGGNSSRWPQILKMNFSDVLCREIQMVLFYCDHYYYYYKSSAYVVFICLYILHVIFGTVTGTVKAG